MGRDIQLITISGEDRRKYRDKVRRSLDVFARMLREHLFESDPAQVGLEIELNLVDDQGRPSMRNADVLAAIADPAWATELGQFNLEINVPPRELAGNSIAGLETEVRGSLNAGDAKARDIGSHLVMIGILPTLGKDGDARGHAVGQRALPGAQRPDLRRPRRGHADRHRRRRAAAHPRRQHHPRGRLHQRAAARPDQPGRVRPVLERGPGHRRGTGGAGRELAVPVRPPALARDQDHAVRAGHRHPARTSSSSRACGPGCGSASGGSPRCSTCSRRTCGTSPRCCRSARRKTRWTC